MSLVLRLTKNIHGTGTIVVLFYSLCVLQGLVDIKKKELYGDTIIDKIRYWTRYIDGNNIKAHFTNKSVGAMDVLCEEIYNTTLHVFSMKYE